VPTKSITAPFSDEDYDSFKLYYGKVYLKWIIDENIFYLAVATEFHRKTKGIREYKNAVLSRSEFLRI
jgi:hypothetical protein